MQTDKCETYDVAHRRRGVGMTGPLVLIAVGAVLLANNLVPGFDIGRFWPLLLVVVGAGVLVDRLRDRR